MIPTLLVVGAALLQPASASTRVDESAPDAQRWPLTVSAFHEALPHSRLLEGDRLNPGLQVGTEYAWIDSDRFQLISTANLGAYHHRQFQNGAFINTEVGVRYRSPVYLEADLLLGLGLLHTIEPGAVYARGEDGRLQRVTDLGRPHAMPSLALGLGFAPPESWQLPLVLYVRCQIFGEVPWSVVSGVLFLPHTALAIGFRLPIDQLSARGES